ncbi:MAG: Asp-tRNA(Asn)/Glu-tRNA(Gln) amidotransferase subunit GatB, partial [Erysipelotrichaceae bacterium]|nr:Asp-tRNA(Asn)/Glu-tRNA(Gln) amidotransferase subunit GatB [Erysipelotrichaceae bacterium]
NTMVHPLDMGLPGTLPGINEEAVRLALRFALSFGMTVAKTLRFDRKNYWSADLPKGFQITQRFAPLAVDGSFTFPVRNREKTVRIAEVHLEEDAAKQILDPELVLLDLNRCGAPLLEVVTGPDLSDGEEAASFLRSLRDIAVDLGISEARMEQGMLRVDVNVSYAGHGRVELKNLNSVTYVRKAVEEELARQKAILEQGGEILPETRHYDETTGKTVFLRPKETAEEYRYFPEPNLPAITIPGELLRELKKDLDRKNRDPYPGLSEAEAALLRKEKALSGLFAAGVSSVGDPRKFALWLVNELRGAFVRKGKTIDEGVSYKEVYEVYRAFEKGKLSSLDMRKALEDLAAGKKTALPEEKESLSEEGIHELIKEVLKDEKKALDDYRNGMSKAFGYLMGILLLRSGGRAKPDALRSGLTAFLQSVVK